ncbi:MAG TPA: class I SAM-dependent methyltransferase [Thermodesulfovibrionales bacterium]|nr:class I SAM-dependent methyltransferase [Thermodesulfovibrionales bacterium]
MYNEKDDFLHHEKEIADFLLFLKRAEVGTRDGMTVLDIGAGQGMHAGFLAEHFQDVYCSDIIDYTSLYGGEFFKLLQEKYARNGYRINLSKVHFIRADGMNLIFRDTFFDMIVSFNMFEHVPEPETVLKEMVRCAKDGGYIYIQFDPIWTADTGSHFFHRVPEPWAHLVYSDDEFVSKMRTSGAPESETEEYRNAMNRKRVLYYRTLIGNLVKRGDIHLISQEFWSGLSHENHKDHPFFKRCLQRGFHEEELLLRGGRVLLGKGKRPLDKK